MGFLNPGDGLTIIAEEGSGSHPRPHDLDESPAPGLLSCSLATEVRGADRPRGYPREECLVRDCDDRGSIHKEENVVLGSVGNSQRTAGGVCGRTLVGQPGGVRVIVPEAPEITPQQGEVASDGQGHLSSTGVSDDSSSAQQRDPRELEGSATFPLRVACLVVIWALTMVACHALMLIVPVSLGRSLCLVLFDFYRNAFRWGAFEMDCISRIVFSFGCTRSCILYQTTPA